MDRPRNFFRKWLSPNTIPIDAVYVYLLFWGFYVLVNTIGTGNRAIAFIRNVWYSATVYSPYGTWMVSVMTLFGGFGSVYVTDTLCASVL